MVFLLLCHQVKNAGRKLGRRCDMCSNYEKQLQSIQGQEAETRDQVCVIALPFYCMNVCVATSYVCKLYFIKHDRSIFWQKALIRGIFLHILFQVKKLQMMLRQANDQLERTMTEKQNLEDSVKLGNEETAAKVCTQ